MIKRSWLIMSVALVLLALLSYLGWALHTLRNLEGKLQTARGELSQGAAPEQIIESVRQITKIYLEAQAPMPPFSSGFTEVSSSCEDAIRTIPEIAASGIHFNRRGAWSLIGSEEHIASRVEEKALAEFLERLGDIANSGIAIQDELAAACREMHVDPRSLKDIDMIAAEVRQTASLATDFAEVGREMVNVKARARTAVQKALAQIDAANHRVDEYAEISVLQGTYDEWAAALRTILEANSALASRPEFHTQAQNQLAEALINKDREHLIKLVDLISPRIQKAHAELERATWQERTLLGRVSRGLGRLFSRAKQEASESRMGREVALAFKTLVLGTKAMYDMMELGPNDDLMSWAVSYESDLNQLMADAEEIRASDGWSLTGKNTFVEALTNSAYEQSSGGRK